MFDALSLNIGDEVGVRSRNKIFISKVTRKTATQVIVEDGSRFNKYGHMVGANKWNSYFLDDAVETRKMIAEIREEKLHRDLCRELREFSWGDIPTEQLQSILKSAKAAIPSIGALA